MNIFYTDHDPDTAAQSLPDKHIVKMPVEAVQMLVSACLRHGIQPSVITSKGTVHKGGYHNHPSTVWAGDTRENWFWTLSWGIGLCQEYTRRYGKEHFAEGQLCQLIRCLKSIPDGPLTPPAQAMPDEFKHADPVLAYRACIRGKVASKPDSFVWRKGTPAPSWL
jgi:hypothetical protein